jgi:RND family efflux transporter MFP subunit
MKRFAIAATAAGLTLLLCALLTGCSSADEGSSTPELPRVEVSVPVEREITDYADFTGRTSAIDSVEVRARVDGYLDSVHFEAGQMVKKGEVLFVIDQRPFERELNRAKASLEEAQAQHEKALTQIGEAEAAKAHADADLDFARGRLERATKLLASGTIRQEEFDQRKSEFLKAQADVQSAVAKIASTKAAVVLAKAAISSGEAAVAVAELNLVYTSVTAPVSGRVSRSIVTVGNLVQAGQSGGGTLLTTIVSIDPIYAYFDVDEHTVQRVQRLIREGRAESAREAEIPVWLGLGEEEGFPHRGTINFLDNQVRPSSGTFRVRGIFPNADESLMPGFFARIHVPIGNPHKGLLVTDRSLDSDLGQRVVYVVDQKDQVVSRPVRLGALHDGLREITDGLKAGDRVIVNGLLQVRPGVTVSATLVEMPNPTVARGKVSQNLATVAPNP